MGYYKSSFKASRRKQIIKTRAEINDIEKKSDNSMKPGASSLKKKKKKKRRSTASQVIKMKKEWTQINKITNKSREITTNATKLLKKIKEY